MDTAYFKILLIPKPKIIINFLITASLILFLYWLFVFCHFFLPFNRRAHHIGIQIIWFMSHFWRFEEFILVCHLIHYFEVFFYFLFLPNIIYHCHWLAWMILHLRFSEIALSARPKIWTSCIGRLFSWICVIIIGIFILLPKFLIILFPFYIIIII